MRGIITSLMVVGLTFSILAQPPQKLSYQTVIRNASGALVTNHAIGMRISILQGSATGTTVYVEAQTPATNANGLATVEIGGGSVVSGIFSGINWSSGPYYIKTETDITGGTSYSITGTSQILSVPYALYSKTAESFNETDPVFGASPAKTIVSGSIVNWNTAYGWGNHSGLYKPISYMPAWSEITGKPSSVSGYGITDAVTITGDQTIGGKKTFSNDLSVNGLTIGNGKGAVTSNTALGFQTLSLNTTGEKNLAAGSGALSSNTTGFRNTAVGDGVLYYNTSGNDNSSVGGGALLSNITGNGNTAAGSGALHYNKDGSGNVAAGFNSLFNNLKNHRSTAIGVGAMFYADDNTSTSARETYNTAVGYEALRGSNTAGNNTGRWNTTTGDQSMYSNTSGNNNTAVGNQALYSNTTGNENTATGNMTLKSNNAGWSNTASGSNALTSNTTGNENTAIGVNALKSNTTGHFNTAMGMHALIGNLTGNYNVSCGRYALSGNTGGQFNTAIGCVAGDNNQSGNYITCIGYDADVASNSLTNATAIGYGAVVNASNKIVLGNSSATTVGGYGTWTNYSDRRLKENIIYRSELGLNFITRLKPVTFNYIDDINKQEHEGLIAQDVEQILNELGLTFNGLIIDDDNQKTMNLSYPSFVIPLITAVQEQQKQIEELKRLVNSLLQK